MIIDYLGRIVHREIATGTNLRNDAINTKQLIKGIYVVKAIMNNGDIKTEKLAVE